MERLGLAVQGRAEVQGRPRESKTGAVVAEASRDTQEVLVATFDLDAQRAARAGAGLFRDRRTDLYRSLLTLDGVSEGD